MGGATRNERSSSVKPTKSSICYPPKRCPRRVLSESFQLFQHTRLTVMVMPGFAGAPQQVRSTRTLDRTGTIVVTDSVRDFSHGFLSASLPVLRQLECPVPFFVAASATPPYKADPGNRSHEVGMYSTLVKLCFRGGDQRDGATVPDPPVGTFGTLLVARLWWLFRDIQGNATEPPEGARCCHGLFCASVSYLAAVDVFIMHSRVTPFYVC
jgi:hypothetical protein